MNKDNQSNYYAVIPASVRYDKRLSPNAKLLYGEITALANNKGYCWANNQYFAGLYDVSTRSVQTWIKQLIDYGYIQSQLIYKNGTKEVEFRKITIDNLQKKTSDTTEENFNHPKKKTSDTTEENFTYNSTYNNTSNSTYNNTDTAAKAVKKNNFNVVNFLQLQNVEDKTIDEWLQVRKAKKSVNTESAIEAVINNIEKAGLTIDAGLKICVQESWAGFKGEWLINKQNQFKGKKQVQSDDELIAMRDRVLRSLESDNDLPPFYSNLIGHNGE